MNEAKFPGDRIGYIEEYVSGENTYDDGESIRATVIGSSELNNSEKTANVITQTKLSIPEINDIVIGNVEAVLGSMLSSREAVSKALQWLKPNHFYKPAHQKIFASMVDLFNNNEQIDTISISDSLKKQKILEYLVGSGDKTKLLDLLAEP